MPPTGKRIGAKKEIPITIIGERGTKTPSSGLASGGAIIDLGRGVKELDKILVSGEGIRPVKDFRLELKKFQGLPQVPTFDTKATESLDPRRMRIVLISLTDDKERPVGGAPVQLRHEGKLVDRATTDQRGLALLRFPAKLAEDEDMDEVKGKVRLADLRAEDIRIPAGVGHIIHEMVAPDSLIRSLPKPDEKELAKALDSLKAATTSVQDLADGLGGATPASLNGLGEVVAKLVEDSSTATASKLLGALGTTVEAATAAIQTAVDSTAATSETRSEIEAAVKALDAAVADVQEAIEALTSKIPEDSVLPRLPVVVTPELADDVLRLTNDRHGPGECLPPDVCSSRGPIIKWVTMHRTKTDGKEVYRLVVRVRQEWNFAGYTLGELRRVDPRDPGSINATLDARLRADLQAHGKLDVATASQLQIAAQAQLGMRSTIDSVLDVVARAKLDAKLRAGIRDDPEAFSGEKWATEFGTALLDWLLPDVGADLDATLDASVHAKLSIDTSLLVSAKLNAAATLTNQLTAAASLMAQGSLSLDASASANINPSLSRAMNLFRFSMYENYLVTSHVEDVQWVRPFNVFTPAKPGTKVFAPADIVEYRPIFQPRLLEPRLRAHFDTLSGALAQLTGPGPLVKKLRFEVDYAALPMSGGKLDIRIEGAGKVTLDLPIGQTTAAVEMHLPAPRPTSTITSAQLTLSASAFAFGGIGGLFDASPFTGAQVNAVRVYSDASPVPHIIPLSNFRVDGKSHVAGVSPNVTLPVPAITFDNDPLVRHINRNSTYYLGLLVEAALRRPSLRYDSPQLALIPPDDPFWQLPLLGFEGATALVLDRAPDKIVRDIEKDAGSAAMIQLAAAGLYTEAVQGEFALTDAIGHLSPALGMATLPVLTAAPMTSPNIVPVLGNMLTAGALSSAAGATPTVTSVAGGLTQLVPKP